MCPDRRAPRVRPPVVRARGFSLIELMVTVAIVAIIASIAYPSYRSYVLKSNRTDAIRALTQAAQTLQRCYSQTYTYIGCAPIPPTAPATAASPNGYYSVSSTNVAAGPPATFTVKATAAGAQVSDTTCRVFTLNQTGQQTAQDSGGADQSATCWGSN